MHVALKMPCILSIALGVASPVLAVPVYVHENQLTKAIKNSRWVSESQRNVGVETILLPWEKRVLANVVKNLKNFAENETAFNQATYAIFGADIDKQKLGEFRAQLLDLNIHDLPLVTVSWELPGNAYAVYVQSEKRIILAPDAPRVSAYLEEWGHWIDAYLRLGDGDAKGDEGEIFRRWLLSGNRLSADSLALVQQENLSARIENDTQLDSKLGWVELTKRNRCDKPVGYYACLEEEDDFEADDHAPVSNKKPKVVAADVAKLKLDIVENIVNNPKPNSVEVLVGAAATNALATPVVATGAPTLTLSVPEDKTGQARAIRFKFTHDAGATLQSHLVKLEKQWRSEKNVMQIQEVLGEVATSQYVLDSYPQATLIFGAEKTQSSGIDQLWDLGSNTILFAEAKGGSSDLSNTPGDLPQMSEAWIIDRLVRLARSGNASDTSAIAAQNALQRFGFKYQGYGFYEEVGGRWVVRGGTADIHYRLSGNPNANGLNFSAAVISDTYSELASNTLPYSFHNVYHNGAQAPKALAFNPDATYGLNLHIPDPQMGSINEVMRSESALYSSMLDGALTNAGPNGISIELELGDNPHGRPASYHPDSNKIIVHKKALTNSNVSKLEIDKAKRSEVASKLAGEIAFEICNAAKRVGYEGILNNVKSGAINSASAYATAILNVEWTAVNDAKTIRAQLKTSGVINTSSIFTRENDFLQMSAGTKSAWLTEQSSIRPGNKDSIRTLYEKQFAEVKLNAAAHVIRKPATNVSRLKNEITAELTKAESEAYQRFSDFENNLAAEKYVEADIARREAEYLANQYRYRANELDDYGVFASSETSTYLQKSNQLIARARLIYLNYVLPMAEDHANKAALAQQRIQELLAKMEYREALNVQAKSEFLLHAADKLAADARSAQRAGFIGANELASRSVDWSETPVTGLDHDNTRGLRPRFLSDSIEVHVEMRHLMASAMLKDFGESLAAVRGRAKKINTLSDADASAEVIDLINHASDAETIVAALQNRVSGNMRDGVNRVYAELNGLKTDLNIAGVKAAWKGNLGTIAKAREVSYEVVKRGGTLHGIVERGGKYLVYIGRIEAAGESVYHLVTANSLDQVLQALRPVAEFEWNMFVGEMGTVVTFKARDWAIATIARNAESFGVRTAAVAASERIIGVGAAEWAGAVVANATPIGWIIDVGLGLWAFSEAVSWFGMDHKGYTEDQKQHDLERANRDDVLDAETQLLGTFDESIFDTVPSSSGQVSLVHPDTQLRWQSPDQLYPYLQYSFDGALQQGITSWAKVRIRLVDDEGHPVPNATVFVDDFMGTTSPAVYPMFDADLVQQIQDMRDVTAGAAAFSYPKTPTAAFYKQYYPEKLLTDNDGIASFMVVAGNHPLVDVYPSTNPQSATSVNLYAKIDTNSDGVIDTVLPGYALNVRFTSSWQNVVAAGSSALKVVTSSAAIGESTSVAVDLRNAANIPVNQMVAVKFEITSGNATFANGATSIRYYPRNGYQVATLNSNTVGTVQIKALYDTTGEGEPDRYLNNGGAVTVQFTAPPYCCGG